VLEKLAVCADGKKKAGAKQTEGRTTIAQPGSEGKVIGGNGEGLCVTQENCWQLSKKVMSNGRVSPRNRTRKGDVTERNFNVAFAEPNPRRSPVDGPYGVGRGPR